MSNLKHTGAKSCFIPKNSSTNKRRGFAVVGYKTKSELKCAIRNSIVIDGKKLTWQLIHENLEETTSHNEAEATNIYESNTGMSSQENQSRQSQRHHYKRPVRYNKEPSSESSYMTDPIRKMDWSLPESDAELTTNNLGQERNTNKLKTKRGKNKTYLKRKSKPDPQEHDPMSLLLQQVGSICDRLSILEQRTRSNTNNSGACSNRS